MYLSLKKQLKNGTKKNGGLNDRGTLANVNEVRYNNDNRIISVDGYDFDDFIESISDEMGSDEFNQTKTVFSEKWALKRLQMIKVIYQMGFISLVWRAFC
ncbi:Uncharacterised protein [[Pasteurella] mairii]|uniref:Uncharacterized protein n=1 Tax=[Pasteurella] mairii TaxID=757 RepID=A0A379B6C3_9PAST|nr:Uncharacterised protein [[Pasteurella] mairii]